MNEKLSAFVDNQLSEIEERRMLEELHRDDDLRARWGRYHLIGAALRRELDQVVPLNVRTAIAAAVTMDSGIGDRRQRERRRVAFNIGKAVGGLAIAATVAAIAILNLPAPVTPESQAPAVASNAAASPAGAPVVAAQPSHPLNAYLREHSEFAQTGGVGTMLPYVRSVNHEDTPAK
jgi:sigma-E factor negative regulatory protein RseA